MYASKTKLDQHVGLILSKAKTEQEKSSKGFSIAKLYFQSKEYDTAKKYLERFLTVQENYAPAQKLMGEILQQSNKQIDLNEAVHCYRRSYEIDDSQSDIIHKICSLYVRINMKKSQYSDAAYWIEKSKSFTYNDSVIFRLQEKIMSESSSGDNFNTPAWEKLLVENLLSRPTDHTIRLKLAKLYHQLNKTDEIVNLLKFILDQPTSRLHPELYEFYKFIYNEVRLDDRLTTITAVYYMWLAVRSQNRDEISEVINKLDMRTNSTPHNELIGWLYLVSALSLERSLTRDRTAVASLMSAAGHLPVDKSDPHLNMLGNYRRSFGRKLPSSDSRLLETPDSRLKLLNMITSHKHSDVLNSLMFRDAPTGGTGPADLVSAASLVVGELDLLLTLYRDVDIEQIFSSLSREILSNLILSPRLNNLQSNTQPESISQMDLLVFLLLLLQREDTSDGAHASDGQHEWWTSVIRSVLNRKQGSNLSQTRQIISRGLEQIRLTGMHGLPVHVLVKIARQLLQFAQISDGSDKVENINDWVFIYFTQVRKLASQTRPHSSNKNRLIQIDDSITPQSDVTAWLNESCLWLAERLVAQNKETEALKELESLSLSSAALAACKIYRRYAERLLTPGGSGDHAEIEAFLNKSRDYVHLALDRVKSEERSGFNEKTQEVEEEIKAEMDFIDSLYASINTDNHSFQTAGDESLTNGIGHISFSTPSLVSATPSRSAAATRPTISLADLATPRTARTPNGGMIRVKPSPERLEIQIRSLAQQQELIQKSILENDETHFVPILESMERLEKRSTEFDMSQKLLLNNITDVKQDIRKLSGEISQTRTEIKSDVAHLTQTVNQLRTTNTITDSQLQTIQQQLAVILNFFAVQQYQAAAIPAPVFSGQGTPVHRATPPVSGLPQFGQYPPQQQSSNKLGSGRPPTSTESALINAAGLNAAGYQDNDYYVDDGDQYEQYEDEECNQHLEGGNTISYMPKSSLPQKPMPQPGFFSPPKLQTKLPEPKPAEPGIPPNVIMNTKDKQEIDKKKLEAIEKPNLTVIVPKSTANITAVSTTEPNSSQPPEGVMPMFRAPAGSTSPVKPTPPSPGYAVEDPNYDPQYAAIIDLPPEIQLITGEEDEEVKFESRAKLFRMSEREWKERGTGVVKLLLNSNGKTRLVMRRDQVLKLCANHYITNKTTLRPQGEKGNAWMYSALDFSDDPEKGQMENLAIRFKNADIANQFKSAVEEAASQPEKQKTSQKNTEIKPAKQKQTGANSPTIAEPPKALWDSFKPPAGVWMCSGCMLQHAPDVINCPACGTLKPGATEPVIDISATTQSSLKFGSANPPPSSTTGPSAVGLFGVLSKPAASTPAPLFGSAMTTTSQNSNFLFGKPVATQSTSQTSGGTTGFKFNQDQPKQDEKPAGSRSSSLLKSLLSEPASTTVVDNQTTTNAATRTSSFGGFKFNTAPVVTPSTTAPISSTTESKPSPLSSFTFNTSSSASSKTTGIFNLGNLKPAHATPPANEKNTASSPIKQAGDVNVEEECQADFKPIIPLPELVEVKTGEENETEIFKYRSKLYRLAQVDGKDEWKERGLGEIKILQDKINPTNYRLVMRREQVHKVCLNHKLQPGLKSTVTQEKSVLWKATDFSNTEIPNGETLTFLARFKTPDIAHEFNDKFTIAVENSGKSSKTKPAGESNLSKQDENKSQNNNKTEQQQSLSDLFKSKPGEWICSVCTIKNPPDVPSCLACENAKPGSTPKLTADLDAGTDSPSRIPTLGGMKFGGSAPSTGTIGAPGTTGMGLFGLNSGAPLKFGGAPPAAARSDGPTVNFSLPAAVPVSSSAAKPSTPTKASSPTKPESTRMRQASTGSDAVSEEERDDIYFEPQLAVLPDIIEVVTGEEDENLLYQHRSKLFRFDGDLKEYKERGIGDVKILQDKRDASRCRVLFRREKVHKIACNHMINGKMTLTPMSSSEGKAWVWYARDYAEETERDEMFAIRFKTADIAQEFKSVFDAARDGQDIPKQTINEGPAKPTSGQKSMEPSPTKSPHPSKTSISETTLMKSETSPEKPSLFGKPQPGSLFSTPQSGSPFGKPAAGSPFSQSVKPTGSIFGGTTPTQPAKLEETKSPAASLFQAAKLSAPATSEPNKEVTGSLFGLTSQTATAHSASVFGGASSSQSASSIFSQKTAASPQLFGQPAATSQSPDLISGQPNSANSQWKGSLFGQPPSTSQPTGSLFGQPTTQTGSAFGQKSAFGGTIANEPIFGGSLFGSKADADDDVIYVSEQTASQEQIERAERFQLPSGFYLYENRSECRGCIGCETNEDSVIDHLFRNKPLKLTKPINKKSNKNSPPEQNKPDIPASTGSGLFETQPVVGLLGESPTAGPFGSIVSTAGPTENLFSLAAQRETPITTKPKQENFKWEGAGTALFNSVDKKGVTGEENPEVYEPAGYFKPVLDTLPDLVEQKTGEEDEQRLFCHRAKLYRYDKDSNQWKERGVGEIKILKHPENGTARLVMRREQVFKLVCNHLIHQTMKLSPMSTSETAWCWFAKDFSDDSKPDSDFEKFAVRFKTIDLAQKFKRHFEESQEFIKNFVKSDKLQASDGGVGGSGGEGEEVKGEEVEQVEGERVEGERVAGVGGEVAGGDEGAGRQAERAGSEGEEEYGDDDDYETEEEIKVLYERSATLFHILPSGQEQKLGIRCCQIVEEELDIVGGMAVYVFDGTDPEPSNQTARQLLFMETPLVKVDKKSRSCTWTAYNFINEDRPTLTTYRAQFSSAEAAENFSAIFHRGIAYAQELKLTEREALNSSMATNPTELTFN